MKQHQKLKCVLRTILCSIVYILLHTLPSIGQADKNMDLTPNFECAARNLEIKFFGNETPEKEGKVVIGKNIKFRAKPSNGDNYQWSLGEINVLGAVNDYWQFLPTIAQGTDFIPIGISTGMNNNDFGNTHGDVQVRAEVGGEEKVAFATAQVFFDKEAFNPYNSNEPNWLYYWKQLIADRLNFNYVVFNSSTNSYDEQSFTVNISYKDDGDFALNQYGYALKNARMSSLYDPNNRTEPIYIPEEQMFEVFYENWMPNMIIGPNASRLCAFELHPHQATDGSISLVVDAGTAREGISCFLENLEHELEHLRIFLENWPNGYRASQDDDGDWYSNTWEDSKAQWGFDRNVANTYSGNYPVTFDCSLGSPLPPNMTAGTRYEECAARNHSTLPVPQGIDADIFNSLDWSYDPVNAYHKNWE